MQVVPNIAFSISNYQISQFRYIVQKCGDHLTVTASCGTEGKRYETLSHTSYMIVGFEIVSTLQVDTLKCEIPHVRHIA